MPAGRPLKFKSVDELKEKIDNYFLSEGIHTITGLAVALGCSRLTLINYEDREEFFNTIKEAKERVEAEMEKVLLSGRAPVGAIFTLKNNFKWKDESQVDTNLRINILNYGGNDSPQLSTTTIPVRVLESSPEVQDASLAPSSGEIQDTLK